MKTKQSTTGIVLGYAGNTIATMSRTQGSVSLSSAEAEYHGMVSASKRVSIKLIVARSNQNELMGEQKSTQETRGVILSTGNTNTVKNEKENLETWCGHRDALPREFVNFDAGSPGASIQMLGTRTS